ERRDVEVRGLDRCDDAVERVRLAARADLEQAATLLVPGQLELEAGLHAEPARVELELLERWRLAREACRDGQVVDREPNAPGRVVERTGELDRARDRAAEHVVAADQRRDLARLRGRHGERRL